VTATRGSVRSEIRIDAPPDAIWAVVSDSTRLAQWFPGVASCTVEGDVRTVVTGSGITMPEHILTVDRLQRRFQYRITGPVFSEHLATIDVHDLGDGSCLVVYGVDAEPSVMALVLGGAAGAALENLKVLVEGSGP
jgi:carbon monoxide dehydrogenase subunit G